MTHTMTQTFALAACAKMLWHDQPMEWRAKRPTQIGLQVDLWHWPDHDPAMREKSGATFSVLNRYLRGCPSNDEGAAELFRTAREASRTAFSISI
jgi:hydroxypyruvate isomerase